MVRNLFLTLVLVSVSVFAAGIPEVKNTDNITMGRGANGDNKEFIFNIGDGATNPKLLINDILKVFNFNKGLDVTGDGVFSGNISGVDGTFTGNGDFSGANLKVGPGTNTDQFMSFKISGEEVGFKFDAATGEVLQKKKAGDAYKKLGTGSGSASTGINAFGEDDNANAEDGTISWSNTGGTFISFEATGGDAKKVIEGERSFRFTPSAQNDVVVGPTLNFDFTKFHGRTCELGIEYTGADENLELHIVDGNGDILNEDLPNNRKIQARSQSTGPFSVSFQCPTAAAIGGDANKGNLHVEIKNVGASVSPAIDWDLTFAGTDRALGTTTLPDSITIQVDVNGSILSSSIGDVSSKISFVSWSAGFAGSGAGYRFNVSGFNFSEIPGVGVTQRFRPAPVEQGRDEGWYMPDVNTLYVSLGDGATYHQQAFTLTLTKQGADAQQKVQTYKASPVTSETKNDSKMVVDAAGNVFDQTSNFVNGNCTNPVTGQWLCDVTPMGNTVNPGCQATQRFGSGGSTIFTCKSNGLNQIEVGARDSANTAINQPFNLTVSRLGVDDRKPQTKNLSLAGIAVNSYAEQSQKQVRIESCDFQNSGTPTANLDLCDNWIGAITDNSPGNFSIAVNTGIFSTDISCTCSVTNTSASRICHFGAITNSNIDLYLRDTNGNPQDNNFSINCQGVK